MQRRGLLRKISTGAIPLFDEYANSIYGFSFDLLDSNYSGNLIKARKDGASPGTAFFTFNGGVFDEAGLLSWVGSDSAWIEEWDNQGGYGTKFLQTNTALQPQIVSAGTLVTDNGKIALDFAGGKEMRATHSTTAIPSLWSCFAVAQIYNSSGEIVTSTSSGLYHFFRRFASGIWFRHNSTTAQFTPQPTTSVQHLWSAFRYDSTNLEYYVDGISQGSQVLGANWNSTNIIIGRTGVKMQELIYFSDDKRTDAGDIHTKRNNYYSTY